MDWNRAIEINREALSRIVAGLVALLGLQPGLLHGATRLPLPVYQLVARALLPAEAAVRRLIVIAARGLVVPTALSRPMPQGLLIERKGTGSKVFPLFDTRKHFGDPDAAPPISGPRIRTVGDLDPRAQFLAMFPGPSKDLCGEAEAQNLTRRLESVKRALDTLPRQAKRMAQWLKRRAEMSKPTFKTPMRPGAPPGLRKRSKDEIDEVLRECHALAWDALSPNTS